MSIAGSRPILCVAGEVQYLGFYISGAQHVVRSQTLFSSLLTFTGGATTGVVTAASGDWRMGMVKMQSSGRPLVAVVPVGSGLSVFLSKDDGATWSSVT
jgi:hypothetical protein